MFLLVSFLLLTGSDVYALEEEYIQNLLTTNGVAEEVLEPLGLTLEKERWGVRECFDTFGPPCQEEDYGFSIYLKDQENNEYLVSFINTDEYIRFENDTDENAKLSPTIKKAVMKIIQETIAREYGTTCNGLEFTNELGLTYEGDGMSIELEEDGSSIKSYKLNHKEGFSGAIEKARLAAEEKNTEKETPDEENKDNASQGNTNTETKEENQNPINSNSTSTETNNEKIVNPSTGDLNMNVIAVLSIASIIGIGISIKKATS